MEMGERKNVSLRDFDKNKKILAIRNGMCFNWPKRLNSSFLSIRLKLNESKRKSTRIITFPMGAFFVWFGQMSNRNMRFMGLNFVLDLDPFHKHTL